MKPNHRTAPLPLAIALLLLAPTLQADAFEPIKTQIPLGNADHGKKPPLLQLEIGTVGGFAHEYVYNQSLKMSELVWDFKNVLLAGAQITFRPKPTMQWRIGYWRGLSSGSGTLDDYDWTTAPYTNWDMWSHSPSTVDSLSKAEISLHKFFAPLLGVQSSIGLGYRKTDITWVARGGTTLYAGVPGTLPNIPGITYTQSYTLPYLSLDATLQGDLSLSVGVAYSRWASLSATDIHHLRALRFEDTISDMTYLDGHLKMGYALGADSALSLSGSYEGYLKKRGNEIMYNLSTGATYITPPDSAGASLNLWQIGLSYEKRF